MTIDVLVPSRFNDARAYAFVETLRPLHDEPEDVRFDFSPISFAFPFATLVIGTAIRRCRDAREEQGFKTLYNQNGVAEGTRPDGSSYLAQMGFFDFLGIDEGKKVGEATGNKRCVPITRLMRDALIARSGSRAALDTEVERLARVLFPRGEGSYEAAAYCFQEAIRNTFEHAETPTCVVFAQAWARGEAEVAVLDWGIGVQESLSAVKPGIEADAALREAIMPGVTSKPDGDETSAWTNAGYGLYVMSELAARTRGSFVLWSSDVRLSVAEPAEVSTTPAPLDATILKVRVQTTDADYGYFVRKIIEEGEARQQGPIKKSPSKSKYRG